MKVRQNRSLKHLGHLVGNSRNGVDDFVANGTDQPRGGATHLFNDGGSSRHVSLQEIVVAHLAATSAKHLGDALNNGVVAHQLDIHHFGDRGSSDVVLGGAEPPTNNDGIAPR